jgi:hypothetical protein
MARAQGAQAQMAPAFETTYGTPPAGGFAKMPFASTTLGAEQPLQTSELRGCGRHPQAPYEGAARAVSIIDPSRRSQCLTRGMRGSARALCVDCSLSRSPAPLTVAAPQVGACLQLRHALMFEFERCRS